MNTTESIYNSIIREKSFVKHFKKGANSQGRTVLLPSCPAALRGRRSTPRAGIPSAMLGRDAGPSAFMQFPWSHALCKLRLLIGRMVDKHFFFFFLKKISTVKVVSWEPEEVRPISQIWKKVIFSDISTPSSHTHKNNQSLGGLFEFTSRRKKYWYMCPVHLGLRMSCKKLQPLLTKGREQANPPKPRHSGSPTRVWAHTCMLPSESGSKKEGENGAF